MVSTHISFERTGYFSKLISDYLKGNSFFEKYCAFNPRLDQFEKVITQRRLYNVNRESLVSELIRQYDNTIFTTEFDSDSFTGKNIQLLKNKNTFTVTTGHQLNLFTGPLYFVYKILSTVKLAEALKEKYPDCNFVPVYWMATEDHDFDEIKSVSMNGTKISWNTNQSGAVGRFNLNDIHDATRAIFNVLNNNLNSMAVKNAIEKAYHENKTLADATRSLVHSLFGNYGLVILDADCKVLKQEVVPLFSAELTTEFSFSAHNKSVPELEKEYGLQVHPREINLFYMKDGLRERILRTGSRFTVHNTNISFAEHEILAELKMFPERFSPNVILRPLYQETILPNIAYIGGPAEVHYWLQLKHVFDEAEIYYPMVLLRNCMLMVDGVNRKAMAKSGLDTEDIFLPLDQLLSIYVKKNFGSLIDITEWENEAKELYEKINNKLSSIDPTLKQHVLAEEARVLKRLKATKQKMIRALKKKESVQVERIQTLKHNLFPGESLQERSENIIPILAEHSLSLLDGLKENMQPVVHDFIVVDIS